MSFRLHGGIPESMVGKVAAGLAVLAALGAFTLGLWQAWSLVLHDSRLLIPSSAAIEISGNDHMTRSQLLSIFGGDVDRNVLTVSLKQRREELESLPWVEHATVMRLLPNKVRVAIVERTPVAFVRQANHIGLVDKAGVLLDMSPDAPSDQHYSFPVLTGISSEDPLSTRAARMKLYLRFTSELDAGAGSVDGISKTLSEVDVSNPEDVKALLPSGASDVLVHFGETDFLARYRRYEQNVPGWKSQYPKLASVDMRYERQVVLEMQAGSSVPVTESGDGVVMGPREKTARGKRVASVKAKGGVGSAKAVAKWRPGNGAASSAKVAPSKPNAHRAIPAPHAAAPKGRHLQTAFVVRSSAADAAKTHTSQVEPQ